MAYPLYEAPQFGRFLNFSHIYFYFILFFQKQLFHLSIVLDLTLFPTSQGQQSEWALLRRHESEDLFGVQVCGCNVRVMAQCARLIEQTSEIDFIDINVLIFFFLCRSLYFVCIFNE